MKRVFILSLVQYITSRYSVLQNNSAKIWWIHLSTYDQTQKLIILSRIH